MEEYRFPCEVTSKRVYLRKAKVYKQCKTCTDKFFTYGSKEYCDKCLIKMRKGRKDE